MNEKAKVIGVGDLFRQSWGLYRERIGLLTKIILLPVAFLVAGDLLYYPVGWLGSILGLVGTILSIFAYLGLIFALQNDISWGEAYRLAWSKIWSYGWLVVLSASTILGGFVMLIIPGIIFLIWFAFAAYVFVLEGEKGMSALLRSRQYVRGHWWQVFGRQLLFALAAIVAMVLITMVGNVLAGEAGISVFVNLFTLVLAPLAVAYVYTLYQNLKSLKPEIAAGSAEGPRGLFYVSAMLGVAGIIALVIIATLAATLFYSGYFTSGWPTADSGFEFPVE